MPRIGGRSDQIAFLRRWDPTSPARLSDGLPTNIAMLAEVVGDTEVDGVLHDVARMGPAAWTYSWSPPHTFVHGDFRADNLIYDHGDTPMIIDWQLCSTQGPARDVASVLLASMTVDDRRAHEDHLIAEYLHALRAGGVAITETDLRDAVATCAIADLAGYAMTIPAMRDEADLTATIRTVCQRRARFLADHS